MAVQFDGNGKIYIAGFFGFGRVYDSMCAYGRRGNNGSGRHIYSLSR